MSNLDLRVSRIVDCINEETADLSYSDRTMVWLLVRELVSVTTESLVYECMRASRELAQSEGGER